MPLNAVKITTRVDRPPVLALHMWTPVDIRNLVKHHESKSEHKDQKGNANVQQDFFPASVPLSERNVWQKYHTRHDAKEETANMAGERLKLSNLTLQGYD